MLDDGLRNVESSTVVPAEVFVAAVLVVELVAGGADVLTEAAELVTVVVAVVTTTVFVPQPATSSTTSPSPNRFAPTRTPYMPAPVDANRA
jgi:hypothetical protein